LSSAYWYYGLAIIGLGLLSTAIIVKKDWKLLVLHVNIAALILPFEVVVLVVFKAYRYLPGIMPDPMLENFLGAYVSNFIIIPATAVTINAFSLSWSYSLSMAIIFSVLDWYFTKIGIYQHFWWKSVYTGLGLIILYAISKRLWSGLQEKSPSLIFRVITIYLTYTLIHNITVFIVNKGGQLFLFQINWPAEPERVHQVLFQLYLAITSGIITLCIGLKLRLRYRLIGIIGLVIINWTIGKYHIFVPQMVDVSAYQLVFVPMIAVPILIILFRLAKLDYLFP
jgi:hypothetical protein